MLDYNTVVEAVLEYSTAIWAILEYNIAVLAVLEYICLGSTGIQRTQLFQPLGEKLSYYNGKGFQVIIFYSKAPES